MEEIIRCISCGNEFDSKHSYTNLGFKKYECPKCKQNFITELVTGYKIFYGLLLLIIIGTGVNSIIEGGFPIVRLILLGFISLIFFKNRSIKKAGGRPIKKTGKKWLIILGVLVTLGILMFIFQGNPIKFNEEQKGFIGNWKGEGIMLVINNDAYISYGKQKESISTSISGPIVELNENNFKIGIGFMRFNFKIDKKPYQDGNLWKMEIDGNELTRATNDYELKIPDVLELKKLTYSFFSLLDYSIYKDDYQSFYDWISKTWQAQTSVDKIKKILSSIPKDKLDKIDLKKILNNEVVYSKPPFLDENNLLILDGYYTGEFKLTFKLTFIYEYPNWKLAGFYLK